MKLQAEYNHVKAKMSQLDRGVVLQYKESLKGQCNDINIRLAWDLLRGTCGTTYICSLYDTYKCHDSHIQTLALRVCKDLNY